MTSEPLDVCQGCYGRIDADDDRCPGCGTSLRGMSFLGERNWMDVAGPTTAAPKPASRDEEGAEPRPDQEGDHALS